MPKGVGYGKKKKGSTKNFGRAVSASRKRGARGSVSDAAKAKNRARKS